MVLLKVCLNVSILFFRALPALSAAYVGKFFACVVRRVSMVCISLRIMNIPFATAFSIILFISFFPSALEETFLLFIPCSLKPW